MAPSGGCRTLPPQSKTLRARILGRGTSRAREQRPKFQVTVYTTPVATIICGDRKVMGSFEAGWLELYNSHGDTGETKNLAAAMPDKAKEIHAPMPTPNKGAAAPAGYQFCRETEQGCRYIKGMASTMTEHSSPSDSSITVPTLELLAREGWNVQHRSVPRAGIVEHFVTVTGREPWRMGAVIVALAGMLREVDAKIVSCEVVGRGVKDAALSAMRRAFGRVQWPVTWLEDNVPDMVCVEVWAVSGSSVEPMEYGGQIAGTLFEDEDYKYVQLGNVLPPDLTLPPGEQSAQLFAKFDKVLGVLGWDFHDTARTWFYNRDILAWYDDFNRVRREFFKERGVFDRYVPASTAVGCDNASGAGLVAKLLGAKPKGKAPRVVPTPSPLQCPAIEYGSAFSRGAEMGSKGQRRVLVSGTASIEPAGATARVGDLDGQVELTMDVVAAILEGRGLSWGHVVRAMGYFASPDALGAWERYVESHDLPDFPSAIFNATVCRDDLLFEFECDALECL